MSNGTVRVDQNTLIFIQKVVDTARLVKIENVIIEPGKVRAIDDSRAVALFQDKDVPDLPFGSIGLTRIDVFHSRFEIAKSMDGFTIEAMMDPTNTFARSIKMKGKGINIDYRCASPTTIQAPKVIQDDIKYSSRMTPEAVGLIGRGLSAMGADVIEFSGDDEGVLFSIEDVNRDALTYQFADAFADVDGDEVSAFKYKYPAKVLLSLLKQSSDQEFFITTRGMMRVIVNGLTLHIPPRG